MMYSIIVLLIDRLESMKDDNRKYNAEFRSDMYCAIHFLNKLKRYY